MLINEQIIYELDETLKLLNGLQNNSHIRTKICQHAEKHDSIIFNCKLDGYSKEFMCEDFIYRGTIDFPGLTMDKVIPLLRAFVCRETPASINGIVMDIYQYNFVEIILPDGLARTHALTCIVNMNSSFYSKQSLQLDELEDLLKKCNEYRQRVLINHQKWLEEYDELKTKEERQIYANSCNMIVSSTVPELNEQIDLSISI